VGDGRLMNPHIDAVPLAHAGRTATIRITWRVLQVLQRDWGEGWASRFVSALEREQVDGMAELVALAAGMSVDEVMDWSPPTAITARALWDAYAMTKMGAKAEADAEAGNPLKAQSILSRASAVLHSVRAWAGPSSGKAPLTPPAST
jgi:hypothetical protein